MSQVDKYGVVACEGANDVEIMTDFVEKPKQEEAPSNKAVLGRYVVTSTIFDIDTKTRRYRKINRSKNRNK